MKSNEVWQSDDLSVYRQWQDVIPRVFSNYDEGGGHASASSSRQLGPHAPEQLGLHATRAFTGLLTLAGCGLN